MSDVIQKQFTEDSSVSVTIDATRTSGENLLRTTFSSSLTPNDTIQKEFTGDDDIQKEWS